MNNVLQWPTITDIDSPKKHDIILFFLSYRGFVENDPKRKCFGILNETACILNINLPIVKSN